MHQGHLAIGEKPATGWSWSWLRAILKVERCTRRATRSYSLARLARKQVKNPYYETSMSLPLHCRSRSARFVTHLFVFCFCSSTKMSLAITIMYLHSSTLGDDNVGMRARRRGPRCVRGEIGFTCDNESRGKVRGAWYGVRCVVGRCTGGRDDSTSCLKNHLNPKSVASTNVKRQRT